MPEGDTIARAAATLDKWLSGRTITAARTRTGTVPIATLVGKTLHAVEPRGKHLLMHFDGDLVMRTHMRMTGSWHVYEAGAKWAKPGWQAGVVLEAGDRVAVCFNVPVVELTTSAALAVDHPVALLGPDVMVEPFDVAETQRRRRARSGERTVGELLLDQQVVAGIGNIFRCESLFMEQVNPRTPNADLADEAWERLMRRAAELMRAGRGARWVYKRVGRRCRRCATAIQRDLLGEPSRSVYWCPQCQLPLPTESGR